MGLRAGWLAIMIFVWVVGVFLGSTFDNESTEETWAGTGNSSYEHSPRSNLQQVMTAFESIQRSPIVGTMKFVVTPDNWEAIYRMMTWQWSFLYTPDPVTGEPEMAYGMFYWIFLFPFVAMGMLSMILLIYGVITGNLNWA